MVYRKNQPSQATAEGFEFRTETKLSLDNDWVKLSEVIPWLEFEEEYAENFAPVLGAPAKPFRMALGALIIKEKLGLTDRETVQQIRENPYLQYFIGLLSYSYEIPFDETLMVHFRKRINQETINQINREIVKEELKKNRKPKKSEENKNIGKLILDATCTPADIKYPTDINLLNEVRKHTEKVIDIIYQNRCNLLEKKPRTYRQLARKKYLAIAKKRRISNRERRKGLRQQLGYIKRDLGQIEKLLAQGNSLSSLSKKDYQKLLVAQEIYRQQQFMWFEKKTSVEERIVSLSQPHIRPIVRGKSGKPTEFGAKIAVSCLNGYILLEHLSWSNFNESNYLKKQVEAYKELSGYYPESVHVDKIYRSRENRKWCQDRGIRISGPPLGRPAKNVSKEKKKQARIDESIRNEIEGKFGQGKRRFGLNQIMSKLPETAATEIAISFLVINLNTLLMRAYFLLISIFSQNRLIESF